MRINPGNIGSRESEGGGGCGQSEEDPIRIGVNAGSREGYLEKYGGVCAEGLVESALRNAALWRIWILMISFCPLNPPM